MAKQGIASIGIDVKINNVALNYVTDIGDIGASPNDLDATCLKDKMTHNSAGVQDAGTFDITILYDNTDTDSDYRVIKALERAGNVVPVLVSFPDNTTFATTAEVYITINGVGVDELIQATISCKLQSDWDVTDPS